jgi:hypothetical protein
MNMTEKYKEEYVVKFASHGDAHEVAIDLKFFAKALKPYLQPQAEEKKEELVQIKCPDNKPGCFVIHYGHKPTPAPEKCACHVDGIHKRDAVVDEINLQISRIKQMRGFTLDDVDAELRALVKLAREEKK